MYFRELLGIKEDEQQPQWTPIPSATDRAVPPPLPLRKDDAEIEARMNAINNTIKNWDAAMKLRESMQQPTQDNSPQAQNLRQAEEDLQQAKEEDAQSGSEGYEKKEDGIFARMASWGSSVGDYLFGKEKQDSHITARQDYQENIEKDDKGVIGYYTDKLFGERTPEEEAKIAEEKRQKGLLGYYGQKANETLETMARSPFSKFVDPTTLLGGQQSMVEDIDADYQNRGLHSLRRELLEQDRARMGTAVGQAQEYARIMNDPNVPEEQKAAITQYMQRNAKSGLGAVSYPKTREQAYLRSLYDFEQQHGRFPSRDERDALAKNLGAETQEAIFAGTPKKPTINDLDDLIIQEATNRAAEKGTSVADELPGVSQEITGDPKYLSRPKTYQPLTPEEKQQAASAEYYGKEIAANESTINEGHFEDIFSMQALLSKLEQLENKGVIGGLGKNTLLSIGSKLGWTEDEVDKFLADFNNVRVNVHGNVIRKINQSGATNQSEQKQAIESSLDLSKSASYNKQRLIGIMNGLVLKRARINDEAEMARRGEPSAYNKASVADKYENLYRNIDKPIDPFFVERNLRKPGKYIIKNGKLLFQAVEEDQRG